MALYPSGTATSPTVTGVEVGYVKEALWPLAVATVEASNGDEPFRSTKIVAEEGVPSHCLTTWTVERFWMLMIVQVTVAPSSAGDVTGCAPPV